MLRAAIAYNAAADHFDAAPLAFWSRHGARAVELLSLRPGDRVLDVGCGTGASAIPAARAVGPTGRVLGIDVAEKMLARAREKAASEGLSNADFTSRDMTENCADLGHLDAVIAVFAVFFVEDIEQQLARLWQRVRPGGKLMVTIWGERALEPIASVFAEEVRRLQPDLPTGQRPWERLVAPAALERAFLDGGLAAPEIYPVQDLQQLSTPDEGWTIAMGSGYRWEIEQLSPKERVLLRNNLTARLRLMKAKAVQTNAIHALARKPV